MAITNYRQHLEILLRDGQKDQAVDFLCKLSEETSYKSIIREVLEPTMVKWGQLWMKGKLSLADGYLSGKVAEEVFLKASETGEFDDKSNKIKGTVVIGNAEDDFHPLGRRLVIIFAKAAGYKVVDLGNDIMANEFVDAAIKNNASIIAVSAMMYTTASNIKKIREEIDKRTLHNTIKLAVGGAVFKLNPELVNEVGGDGTAQDAMQSPDLFDRLMSEIVSHKN